MYAIIADGGRQYRVEEGMVLDLDRREEVEAGASLSLDRVLAVGEGEDLKVGAPEVSGAKVECEVIGQVKGPRLVVRRFRRRKNSRTRNGHRQPYTRVKVTGISAG